MFQWNLFDDCVKKCSNSNNLKNRIDYVSLGNIDVILQECMEFSNKNNKSLSFSISSNTLGFSPDFWKLLGVIHENNLRFNICGNDLKLNSKMSEKLSELGCSYYQMNLDGLRKTHDSIHGRGSYDVVSDNIDCLHEFGVKTYIFTSVSQKNISQVPWIIDEAVRKKVDKYHFSHYCSSSGIDLFDYEYLLEKVWEKYMQYRDFNTSFSIKGNILSLLSSKKYQFENSKNRFSCKGISADVNVEICDVNVENKIDEQLISIF